MRRALRSSRASKADDAWETITAPAMSKLWPQSHDFLIAESFVDREIAIVYGFKHLSF
jgi:hypothetical protein